MTLVRSMGLYTQNEIEVLFLIRLTVPCRPVVQVVFPTCRGYSMVQH